LKNIYLISPKYSNSDYKIARDGDDWPKMIEIFIDRLEGRFLKPIRLIINDDSGIGEFAGFSIIAIDCLIIETLQQFYDGKDKTPKYQGKDKFKNFLTNSKYFNSFFDEELADIFYEHFRCGLLHQGQTMGKSLIKTGQNSMIVPVTPDNIKVGFKLDRNKFHDALEQEINNYVIKLTNNKDKSIREHFIKKMNFICNCG
jgi:hypothetical protein